MRPNAQRPITPPIPAAMSREPPRIACWHWERLVAALLIRVLVALVAFVHYHADTPIVSADGEQVKEQHAEGGHEQQVDERPADVEHEEADNPEEHEESRGLV